MNLSFPQRSPNAPGWSIWRTSDQCFLRACSHKLWRFHFCYWHRHDLKRKAMHIILRYFTNHALHLYHGWKQNLHPTFRNSLTAFFLATFQNDVTPNLFLCNVAWMIMPPSSSNRSNKPCSTTHQRNFIPPKDLDVANPTHTRKRLYAFFENCETTNLKLEGTHDIPWPLRI